MVGQVIKGVAGIFSVKAGDSVYLATGRKKIRQDGEELLVGDYVEFLTIADGEAVIESILPRKNKLIRPYVANVDAMVIVIAPKPKPDLILADKLLVSCIGYGIEAVICLNKADIAASVFKKRINYEYGQEFKVIEMSAETGEGSDVFLNAVAGKCVCLAGQSAVGKSSIINKLLSADLKVGGLSKKTGRGRHTTREVEIFDAGTFRVVDSCGFSSYEFAPIEPFELGTYYPEFDKFRAKCEYDGCTHTKEENCAVKEAVNNGGVSKGRYDRYLILFEKVKEQWERRYE